MFDFRYPLFPQAGSVRARDESAIAHFGFLGGKTSEADRSHRALLECSTRKSKGILTTRKGCSLSPRPLPIPHPSCWTSRGIRKNGVSTTSFSRLPIEWCGQGITPSHSNLMIRAAFSRPRAPASPMRASVCGDPEHLTDSILLLVGLFSLFDPSQNKARNGACRGVTVFFDKCPPILPAR